jgi:hypothetical protein
MPIPCEGQPFFIRASQNRAQDWTTGQKPYFISPHTVPSSGENLHFLERMGDHGRDYALLIMKQPATLAVLKDATCWLLLSGFVEQV